MITIRTIQANDAQDFLALCKRLDEETQFMMLEAGERTTTRAEQQKIIQNMLAKENQTILVAESEGTLVGHLTALGGSYHRNQHSAYLITGILQAFTGQGLGRRLFTEIEQWGRAHGIHRLELTVMKHNERAIARYKQMGFEIEGTKKHSLCISGVYIDEYYMGKLL